MGSMEKRTEMWNSMLDAEMNEIYWSDEAKRYGSFDRSLKLTIAVLSSGTTVALFSTFSSHPILVKVLALLVTVVSLVHSNFFSTNRLKLVTGLAARWKEIAIEYRLLWAELEDEEMVSAKTWKEYETVCRREKQIDESAFTINRRRLENAQHLVITARRIYEQQDHG